MMSEPDASPTLLIVDDNASVRQHLTEIVEELNLASTAASNGREALSYLEEHPEQVEAILLDIEMPEMGGIAFLESLPATGEEPTVIVCSSRRKMDIIKKAISLGASDYVMKPFDRPMIKNKLKAIGLVA